MQLHTYGTFEQPRSQRWRNCFSRPTSKSLVLVLLWTVVVGFINSEVNSSPYFALNILHPDIENVLRAVVALYIILAMAMMCYPLGGLLADVYFRRYKVLIASLIILTLSMLIALTEFVLTFQFDINKSSQTWKKALFVLGGVSTFIFVALGLAGFRSNVVQFGLDQLLDAPSNKLGAFVHLYVWADRIGYTAFDIIYTTKHCYINTDQCTALTNGLLYGLPVGGFLILSALVVLNCFTHRMFNKERVKYNPYKMILRVLKFTLKHNRPVAQPSAFTYCDDFKPSRMDFAKERYGGPFTTSDVEDVKTFIRVSIMLLCLGPVFVITVPTSFYLFSMFAMYSGTHIESGRGTCTANWMLLQSGLLSDIISTLTLPLYTWLLFSVLSRKNLLPRILHRVQFAAILFVLSIVSMFVVDLTGQVLKVSADGEHNGTCMFLQSFGPNAENFDPLNLHWSVLIFPNLTKTLALDLIMASTFEFISAQSPHTMKGVLVGLLFAVRGFFQFIQAVLLFPFSNQHIWKVAPQMSCESSYYLITIVISLLGTLLFTIAARKYQYRKREEEPYSQSRVEEIFDRMLRDREQRRVTRINNIQRANSYYS